eukprot:TRINITY_DN60802_c0_g1_i1.p3 TRINITY_DN60802_c0_g1~~TRINITY_DN60802_c0_g1_i1.p3  ORF type:complete len:140 (+),score=30.48 TRINITY_DN60802_c0_g1_i1:407-826(+)
MAILAKRMAAKIMVRPFDPAIKAIEVTAIMVSRWKGCLMSDDFFPVPESWAKGALMDRAAREADYARSIDDADAYWLEKAQRLDWISAPTKANESSFHEADFGVKWFADGILNVSANCVEIGRAVQQECRDRSRMPSSA